MSEVLTSEQILHLGIFRRLKDIISWIGLSPVKDGKSDVLATYRSFDLNSVDKLGWTCIEKGIFVVLQELRDVIWALPGMTT